MTKKEKEQIIRGLIDNFSNFDNFYIINAMGLEVGAVNDFRRICFEQKIVYQVVKNTFIKKALEQWDSNVDYNLFSENVLKGFSGILFIQEGASIPAKVIKSFIKRHPKAPLTLKGASIGEDLFIGEKYLETLSKLKSKEELIGDIIILIKGPMMRMLSALQVGGDQIVNVLRTLAKREDEL